MPGRCTGATPSPRTSSRSWTSWAPRRRWSCGLNPRLSGEHFIVIIIIIIIITILTKCTPRPVDVMTVAGAGRRVLESLASHSIRCDTYIQDLER